jgi:hypothetical protein
MSVCACQGVLGSSPLSAQSRLKYAAVTLDSEHVNISKTPNVHTKFKHMLLLLMLRKCPLPVACMSHVIFSSAPITKWAHALVFRSLAGVHCTSQTCDIQLSCKECYEGYRK